MSSQFSSYTKEELQKKIKKQELYVGLKFLVVIFMVILAVFSTMKKKISLLTFLPLFFIPMLLIMISELKKMKKELNRRK